MWFTGTSRLFLISTPTSSFPSQKSSTLVNSRPKQHTRITRGEPPPEIADRFTNSICVRFAHGSTIHTCSITEIHSHHASHSRSVAFHAHCNSYFSGAHSHSTVICSMEVWYALQLCFTACLTFPQCHVSCWLQFMPEQCTHYVDQSLQIRSTRDC